MNNARAFVEEVLAGVSYVHTTCGHSCIPKAVGPIGQHLLQHLLLIDGICSSKQRRQLDAYNHEHAKGISPVSAPPTACSSWKLCLAT
jgi:hypothetical protein